MALGNPWVRLRELPQYIVQNCPVVPAQPNGSPLCSPAVPEQAVVVPTTAVLQLLGPFSPSTAGPVASGTPRLTGRRLSSPGRLH